MFVPSICSVFILFCMFISWVFPKKINIKDSLLFFVLVSITNIYLILEVVAYYSAIVEWPIKDLMFRLYMVALVFRCFMEFSYLCIKTIKKENRSKINKYLIVIPIIGSVLTMILPISASISSSGGLIVVGASVYTAYITACVIFIVTIIYLIVYHKVLAKWSRICFISTLVIWTIGVCVQFPIEQGGILGIALVLSLCASYSFFENPLNFRNYKYNCFKDNCIGKYIERLLSTIQKGYVFTIDIYSDNNYGDAVNSIDEFKRSLIAKLNRNRGLRVFYSIENEIVVVGKDSNFDKNKDFIRNELDKYYLQIDFKMDYHSKMIYCKDLTLFTNYNDYLSHLSYAKNQIELLKERNINFEIDYKLISVTKEEENVKNEIKLALDEDRVVAFVQPIFSVKEHKFKSAEALCRISKDDGKYMLPYQFIPISEKCGLDIPIGYRMVEKVCQILSSSLYGHLFESIDINLSIAECEQENLPSRILSITQKYNIDPKRINFEITESGFIDKMSTITNNIKLLTDFGFGFSLDDFGSGESNLDYLVRMPAKFLKLDMYMIRAYFENDRAKNTVLSIVKIAHEMGMQVVAEGVETKEQYEELSERGIDFIQGYYFYKPMTISEYDASLK